MTTTQPDFENKVVLVTGGGSGIGRAAAIAFARQGAKVVLAGRRAELLESVASSIAAAGAEAKLVPTDLTDPVAVEALVGQASDWQGRLDVAFNNAGLSGTLAPIVDASLEEFDRVIATNLRGPWLLMKHELRVMYEAGRGAIVNTSSIAATGGTAGLSGYAASKGALDALIRPIALEAGAHGVRVNNVSPGMTANTDMTAGAPPEFLIMIGSHSALKRMPEPEEIAAAALWLASDAASYVTGQSILVDGGFNIAGQR